MNRYIIIIIIVSNITIHYAYDAKLVHLSTKPPNSGRSQSSKLYPLVEGGN